MKLKIYKINDLKISVYGIIAFFLAISPVLDPYIICEIGMGITIRINDIFIILSAFYCFNKQPKFDKKSVKLVYLIIFLSILNMIACIESPWIFFITIKNLTIFFIYSLCFMYIWKTPCREKFFKYAEIIGIFVAVVVILQFICGHLSINMWNGKIPLIKLSKYDGWAGYIDKNTGEIRPCGIFQESSYVAIYLSVIFFNALATQKLKKASLYGISALLTSSLLAFLLIGISLLYFLINAKKMHVTKGFFIKIIASLGIIILIVMYLSKVNDSVALVVNYVSKRIINFSSDLNGTRMSSSKYRVLGHIDLFKNYTVLQKVIGVGIGQYASRFNVSSYSNVIVTTLLNSGIVGLLGLCIYMISLLKNNKNIIYAILFILVLCFDYQWFSMFFFYLLSPCYLKNYVDCKNRKINVE